MNDKETFGEQRVLDGLATLSDEAGSQELAHRRLARLRRTIAELEQSPQEAISLDAIARQIEEEHPELGGTAADSSR
ncbi:hypothetical protein ACGFJT_44410 [Actinomadura geliboluensis]|uniref:hypothetical protein n=1 Tax=Actinomadura geliboluensis TaxID=882440 RepID=UPI0037226B9E